MSEQVPTRLRDTATCQLRLGIVQIYSKRGRDEIGGLGKEGRKKAEELDTPNLTPL